MEYRVKRVSATSPTFKLYVNPTCQAQCFHSDIGHKHTKRVCTSYCDRKEEIWAEHTNSITSPSGKWYEVQHSSSGGVRADFVFRSQRALVYFGHVSTVLAPALATIQWHVLRIVRLKLPLLYGLLMKTTRKALGYAYG